MATMTVRTNISRFALWATLPIASLISSAVLGEVGRAGLGKDRHLPWPGEDRENFQDGERPSLDGDLQLIR
jgi:hypothetical protein